MKGEASDRASEMEADIRWVEKYFQFSIYTNPKAAVLTRGFRQNLGLRLKNAAPSQTKAADLKRGFRRNLKLRFKDAASDQI